MYAKVFSQIFDSSIREDPETRFTFMDMLVLSDSDGVVDMTHEAIAARTNRPIDLIRATIAKLEGPDPKSRTPDNDGRRISRLDDHRDWGWLILNYDRFRKIASEEQRNASSRARSSKYRAKIRGKGENHAPVTPRHAPSRQSRHADADADADRGGGGGGAARPFPEIQVPSWEEVRLECVKIGLVEWRARDWFNKMETIGWIDEKKREITKWRSYLLTVKSWWERDGRPMTPPKGRNAAKPEKHPNIL